MNHITVIADENFTLQAVTLIRSIFKTSSTSLTFHLFCVDNKVKDSVNKLYKNIVTYDESIFDDKNLLNLKTDDYKYFLYALSSAFTKYVIDKIAKINESVTYIDADVFFHTDINLIYKAFGEKSVGIFRHRFLKQNESCPYGMFNVGVVHFKKTKMGSDILNWWTDSVVNRRFFDSLGTCGDQKYLDVFPALCGPDIFIDSGIGHGAPWNWKFYKDISKSTITYENETQPLVFTHFSKFSFDFDTDSFGEYHYPIYTDNGKVYENSNLKDIHMEYFQELKKTGEMLDFSDIKIAVGMIVFEGDYVLKQTLDQLYPHVDQILVSEGPVKFWQNKGRSTSTDDTNNILDNYDDPLSKLKVVHGQFDEKDDQSNAYTPFIKDNIDYLWMIDSDEVYRTEDILNLKKFLKTHNPTSVGVQSCSFYGGFNRYLTGFELNVDNFIRVFKFFPQSKWVLHRPPKISFPKDVKEKHINSLELYEQTGIQMYHYSYVFPNQVERKTSYYSTFVKDGTIADYMNQVYLPWMSGEMKDVEEKFHGVHEWIPERRGDCYTTNFKTYHPEEIVRSLPQLNDRIKKELYEKMKKSGFVSAWFNETELPKAMINGALGITQGFVRLEFTDHFKVLKSIMDSIKFETIADIGCGAGELGRVIGEKVNYTGFDLPHVIENVSKVVNKSLNYVYFDTRRDFDYSKLSSFDLLVCNSFISEVSSPLEVLSSLIKHMKKYIIIHRQKFNQKQTYYKNYTTYAGLTTSESSISVFDMESILKLNYSKVLACIDNYNGENKTILICKN
jgi:2-polyprenyl-3-methyl-5-hydroxy-6-metoxy-1,4-benzoquinol methylase